MVFASTPSVQARALAEAFTLIAAALRKPSRTEVRPLAQWLALRFFSNPRPVGPTAPSFAAQHHVTQATGRNTIDQLIADGLLEPQSNVMDRRTRYLLMTDTGAQLMAADPVRLLAHRLTRDLRQEQFDAFLRSVRVLVLAGSGLGENRTSSFAYARRRLRHARSAANTSPQSLSEALYHAFCTLAAITPVIRGVSSTKEGTTQVFGALRYFAKAPVDQTTITAFALAQGFTARRGSDIVSELRRRAYLVKIEQKPAHALTDLGRRTLMRDPIKHIAAPIERSLTPVQIALAGQVLKKYLDYNTSRNGQPAVVFNN